MPIITEDALKAVKPKTEFFAVRFNIVLNICLLLLGCLTLFLILLIKSKTAVSFRDNPFVFIYGIFIITFILFRIIGAMFYRYSISKVMPLKTNGDYEPFVSFVVPCKNEEKDIARTVLKCFEADYPKEKLEVIVINDGSTDNTLEVLNSIKPRFENLTIIDWKINRGKRQGMAEGFKRAKGEIVVQLDSDSYIKPDTFRHLIKIFENPEIGAVSAHTDPENADKNLLTKMQAAYYFTSFRIFKAAESTFMSVFCCSGCASAYRKSAVLPILDEWLNEKFLGLPVTWGDDRALTSRVLKMGHKTIYTDQTQAYTIVPHSFKQLTKQQIRWKKSWIINFFFICRFLPKKSPFIAFIYFFPLIIVSVLAPFILLYTFVYTPIFKGYFPFYYALGAFLMVSLVVIYYKFLAKNNQYWPYLFIWQAFNMFFLSCLMLYAIVRIQDRGWGTR